MLIKKQQQQQSIKSKKFEIFSLAVLREWVRAEISLSGFVFRGLFC